MKNRKPVLKRGSIQAVSEWEDIPEDEVPVNEAIGMARTVLNHDWEQARKAAREDTKRHFGR